MAPDSRRTGQLALEQLTASLSKAPIKPEDRPNADPHSAAVAGLLVADFVARPELSAKLEELEERGKFDPAQADALRVSSRSMLQLIETIGYGYLPAAGEPSELETKCEEVRAEMLERLDAALGADAGAQVWLHAVRAGSGSVDVIFDLRTLAKLYIERKETLGTTGINDPAAAAARAAELALALENELAAGEDDERRDARALLAQAWGPFVTAYGHVCEAGREASRGQGAERRFPLLAAVAAHKRAHRSIQSLVPRSRVSSAGIDPVSIPKAAPVPGGSQPPPSGRARISQTPESRRVTRHHVELEVGIGTESNFYLGFTENLSSGGVFVATYLVKPIGSSVSIDLTMPDGSQISVSGTVKWTRGESPGAWPGMGVQFAKLSDKEEAAIRAFTTVREPIFYDD